MVKMGRPKGKLPEQLEERAIMPEEAERFLLACRKLTTRPKANRMWHLYFRILWETGIRCGEALKIEKKDLVPGAILIHRAKKRAAQPPDRFPIQVWLEAELRAWATEQKGRLFPVSYAGVYWAFRKAALASNIRAHLTPHSFRHGFAFNVQRQSPGSSAEVVAELQRLLGHSRRELTERYTKPTMESLKERIARIKF